MFEADLKNFFGSLDHGWLLRFVEHRVGDPRILSLIRKWLKAGVMEGKTYEESEVGTPQVKELVDRINLTLKGHYNYYGMGGNYQSLVKIYNKTKWFLKKMLSSRSWKGNVTWDLFDQIMVKYPILRPYIKIPYTEFTKYAML